jgi:hypothetical protein
VSELIAHKFVDVGVLMQRASSLAFDNDRLQQIKAWLIAKSTR